MRLIKENKKPYYCKLEYLKSSGTQYIDTGIVYEWGQSFETFFSCSESGTASKLLFGIYDTTVAMTIGRMAFNCYSGWDGTTPACYFYGNPTASATLTNQSVNKVEFKNGDWYFNDSLEASSSEIGNPNNLRVFLFASSLSDQSAGFKFKGKIYSSRIWDENGVLIRDFIPVLDRNMTPCMYDKVSNTLFYNQGTGEFSYEIKEEDESNVRLICQKHKPYYCEVEYLESSGTQYIDTGIVPTIKTKTAERVRILSSGGKTPDFTRWSGNPTYDTFGTYLAGANIAVYYGRYQDNKAKSFAYTIGTDFEVINDINEIRFNNSTQSVTRDSTGWTNTTYTLCLFAGNNVGNISFFADMRMYYYKIWDNGELLRDMIPVLDWNMVPCMYDKVSNKLFYNQGTGDFTYGRQIHYVEYLESTGSTTQFQWINTGVNPTTNTKVRSVFASESMGSGVTVSYYGARVGSTSMSNFAVLNDATTRRLRFDRGSFENSGNSDTILANTFYDVVQDKNENYVNGVKVSESNGNFSNVDYPIFIFGINNNGNYLTGGAWTEDKKKFKLFQIWDNDILLRDYKPAVDENGVGFMFDRVEHKIYDNAGTGAFKYPDVPLEYLESTGTQYINTGLFSTADSNVDVIFSFTSMAQNDSCSIFGGRSSYSYAQNTFSLLKVASSSQQFFRFDCRGQEDIAYSNQLTWDSNSKYRFTYGDGKYKISNITTNESLSGFMSQPYTFTTYPICIFAINSVGEIGLFMKGRIYEYKYSDGTNTINLKPVMRNGVAGMLDTVNDVFYTNQGTGTFNFRIKEKKIPVVMILYTDN